MHAHRTPCLLYTSVCCRGCSERKLGLSLEEASMVVLPAGAVDIDGSTGPASDSAPGSPPAQPPGSVLAPGASSDLDPTNHNPSLPDPTSKGRESAGAPAAGEPVAVDAANLRPALDQIASTGNDKFRSAWLTTDGPRVVALLEVFSVSAEHPPAIREKAIEIALRYLADEAPRWRWPAIAHGFEYEKFPRFVRNAYSLLGKPQGATDRRDNRDAAFDAAFAETASLMGQPLPQTRTPRADFEAEPIGGER